jgi:hypothetical protein
MLATKKPYGLAVGFFLILFIAFLDSYAYENRSHYTQTEALLGEWESEGAKHKFYSNGSYEMIEASGTTLLQYTVGAIHEC